ncbi:MAG TPA: 30S ribosomal protein S12 methylthiotransferase RimO [Prolixibacteraceae bacterium]|nr:30S ribosomal protein S12 methylthiotransferase RimO [Prolixibacteraceae bacterium]
MQHKTINIITLGCSKNLVDSERLMRQFEEQGFDVRFDDEAPAEILLINTCGFILDAKEESVNMIMDGVRAKEAGLVKKLYVMGCLSARYREELKKEIPEVDCFFGKFDFDAILRELEVAKRKDLLFDRYLTTPSHYAYLKIAEGCDRSCSFCAIPQFTGKHQSVPVDDLVKEASLLAQKGVKELLLISQELTYYGIDLYKKRMLPELIHRLSEIGGIEWIRLHYAYPAGFPVELLKTMRENPKVCRYLDVPLQHISDRVLAKMRRNITGAETRQLIQTIRDEVPGIALRTTLIVGHPGETEEDFQELLAFVDEMKFERLGVFPYSHEEDTWGYRNLDDTLSQQVKEERLARIMELQQALSEKMMNKWIGKRRKVLIDRIEGEHWIGRTEHDSPEVDGEVLINRNYPLKTGGFYTVEITGTEAFDSYGKPV